MPPTTPDTSRFILLRDAARTCGYNRPNTMREKHLDSPSARETLGHQYDDRGRVVLLRESVEQLAARLREERQGRSPWRIRNLKHWGQKGARARPRQRPAADER